MAVVQDINAALENYMYEKGANDRSDSKGVSSRFEWKMSAKKKSF